MIVKNTGQGPAKEGPTHVAFYIRVSSDKQAKKLDGSLDTQLDLLNKFVDYKRASGVEWIVSERYVEGEQEGKRRGKSAKDVDRPTFQKMLSAARAQLIDVIAITKIDRISRSVLDFLLLVQELDKYGVKVVSLHENIDLTTPAGKFQTIIMIALAQHERETIAARVKEKVAWRAEKGLPIGPPPIGYVMKEKKFIIDEVHARHIRELDTVYLEHQSSDVVVKEFRQRGYRTPRGAIYTKQLVCQILRSPTYAAKIVYEGNVYQAQWEPLRSKETDELIQRTMDRNQRHKNRLNKETKDYVYLLQGLLRCGRCGHKMSPQPGIGRNKRYYPYYCCKAAEKSCGTACPFEYVPAEAADRAILEFLKKLHLNQELVETFAKRANEFASQTVGKLREDLERVKEQLTAVRTKISNMVEVIADRGKAAMASLGDRLEALESERAELEGSESKLRAELEAELTQEIAVQDQIRALALFDRLVSENEDQPERIKSLLPRFVDYVVWHSKEKGEGDIELALFPNPLSLASEVVGADSGNGHGIRSQDAVFRPRVKNGMPGRS